ncbi:MAG: hypothetical protein J6P40_02715 [Oscillospiraceae bacterium]|nr:hypothetical protein [Oscillospiraceae bacterium]
MSAIVDLRYYTLEYKGNEADSASFPALNAHASRIIGALTHWRVDENTIDNFPSLVRTLYRLAICSQIDFLAINGMDSISGGGDEGFTVGKVSVHDKSTSNVGGAMSAHISPAAKSYLEQTGLMNPQVATVESWW